MILFQHHIQNIMSYSRQSRLHLTNFVEKCLSTYVGDKNRGGSQHARAVEAARIGLSANKQSPQLYIETCNAIIHAEAPAIIASFPYRFRLRFLVWLAAIFFPGTLAERSQALYLSGVNFIRDQQPLLSRYLLREALRIASKPPQIVDVLTQLAVACDELGDRNRALQLLSLGIRSCDNLGVDIRTRDACLRLYAAAMAFAGNLRGAVDCLDLAEGLCADVYPVSPLQARVAWTIAICRQAFSTDQRDRISLKNVLEIALTDIYQNQPLDQRRAVDVDMLQHALSRTTFARMALLSNMLTIRLAREVPALALAPEDMAIALNNLGNSYLHLEWNADARSTFLQTLELPMDHHHVEIREKLNYQRMHAQGGIGFAFYNDAKESPADRARPAFEAAALAFAEAAQTEKQCSTRTWLDCRIWVCAGLVHANLGLENEALHEFAKALLAGHDKWAKEVTLDQIGDLFVPESDTLLKLLEGFRLLQHPHAAVLFGKAAVHAVHRESLPNIDMHLSTQYVQSRASTHRELIDCLTRVGRHNEAEQVFDLLKEDSYCGYAQRSDISLEVESLVAINSAEKIAMERCGMFGVLAKAAVEHSVTENTITLLAQALGALNANIERCVEDQRRIHGDDKSLHLESSTAFLGRHAALVRYLVLPRSTQIHVIAEETRTVIENAVTFDTLSQLVFRIRQQCRADPTSTQESFIADSLRLHNALIAPLQRVLPAHVNHLYIQVDSPLEGVPFATLFDGTGYLVERYAVSHLNPAGNSSKIAISDPPAEPCGEVTVFACSELPGNSLPGAAIEGRAIQAGLVAGGAGLKYRPVPHTDCTSTTLLNRLGSTGQQLCVVHVATHAEFNATSDQLSVLELADGGMSIRRLREALAVSGCDLGLFVLSACGTARQDMDVEGFSVTLLKAGVRSVVSSLWETIDVSAPDFFERLYATCDDFSSTSKLALALRQAQLAMLRGEMGHGEYRHPAHWAPYVLTTSHI